MNFLQYTLNDNYFAYQINSTSYRQNLDLTTVADDSVVIFPRNIYKGEPFAEPLLVTDPRDSFTYVKVSKNDLRTNVMPCDANYKISTKQEHPLESSKFAKLTTWGGLCKFGYCSGFNSAADYGCGVRHS